MKNGSGLLLEAGEEITPDTLAMFEERGFNKIQLLATDHFNVGATYVTPWRSIVMPAEDALIDIYRVASRRAADA